MTSQNRSTAPGAAGLTLFVVDDEPAVLRTLKRALEQLGARVRTFATPGDALKIARAAPPAGVITDYYMPDHNGVAFLQQLEQALPDVARVILTGGRVDERLEQAIERGTVQRLLTKPWSAQTLQEMLGAIRHAGAPVSPARDLEARPDDRPEASGARVLVVDDDRFFLEFSTALLSKLGCTAESVSTIARMHERLAGGGFDLVLMDLVLDGESGVDGIRQLERDHPGLPAIAVTGRLERRLTVSALQAGAAGVLHKPLDALKLDVALKHCANLRALEADFVRRPSLDALLSIQRSIASGTSLDLVFETLMQQAIRVTRADRVCVFLADQPGDDQKAPASYGWSPELLEEQLPLLEGLCGRVYGQRQPQEVIRDVNPESEDGARAAGPQAILALPLRGRDSIVGVLVVGREAAAERVEREVLDTLLLLAGEVGQAVERRRVEEQTRELDHSVMRQDKLVTIGELASGVAHEINNPLGFVSSNIHSIKEYLDELRPILECLGPGGGGQDPQRAAALARELDLGGLLEDLPACVAETIEGIDRVLRIVADLRTFARDDSESREPCDLNQILDQSIQILRNQLKHKVELIRDFGALPAVECFPGQLSQVFINLINNSLQAVERGGRIWLRTRGLDDRVEVEIGDDGCGMRPGVLERIFEPFFTTKPRGVGTGLGLSIARKIVERHGGRISARSQPDQGTTFTIELPLAGRPD